MKSILLNVIAVVLIALILVVFIVRGKARRQGQKGKTDISKLKPGKANYEFGLDMPLNDAAIAKIEQLLAQNHFRIIDGVRDGLIAYSGKNENATLWADGSISILLNFLSGSRSCRTRTIPK